jgi:hypothetical protein
LTGVGDVVVVIGVGGMGQAIARRQGLGTPDDIAALRSGQMAATGATDTGL